MTANKSKIRRIGVLTGGGDAPGRRGGAKSTIKPARASPDHPLIKMAEDMGMEFGR